jgi:hypothetical protein
MAGLILMAVCAYLIRGDEGYCDGRALSRRSMIEKGVPTIALEHLANEGNYYHFICVERFL